MINEALLRALQERMRKRWPPGGGAPIDPVAYAPGLQELTIIFLPVRLIAEHLALRSVQQLRQLSDIGGGGIGRSYGVDDTALVGADVQLHPEVPVLALARLLHLRVARRTGVFGGTGSTRHRRRYRYYVSVYRGFVEEEK